MKVIKRQLRKLIILVLLVVFTLPAPTMASFLDDWIDQVQSTDGGYYSGARRGYATGGTFSARWNSSSSGDSYLVGFQAPRFSGGCGGIDMFLGGISFMDYDMLVEKLQGILMNAASIAFDMALSTLCEQCSVILKNFEQIANNLNQMAGDECAIATGLMNAAKDKLSDGEKPDETAEKGWLSESMGKMASWTDTAASWTKNNREWYNMETDEMKAEIEETCNDTIKNTLLKKCSMLDNIGVGSLGLDTEYVATLRALVGDIRIYDTPSGSGKVMEIVESCDVEMKETKAQDLSIIAEEGIWSRDVDSNGDPEGCIKVSGDTASMYEWIETEISAIAENLEQNKIDPNSLSAFSQDILKNANVNIIQFLLPAVIYGATDDVIGMLTNYMAIAYQLKMYNDILAAVKFVEVRVKKLETDPGNKEDAANAAAGSGVCDINLLAGPSLSFVKGMRDKVEIQKNDLREDYAKHTKELATSVAQSAQQIENIRILEFQTRQELMNTVGPQLYGR